MTTAEAWEIVKRRANEGDVEETLIALAGWFRTDKDTYIADCVTNGHAPHTGVVELLDSCAESMEHSSFNFYASTK